MVKISEVKTQRDQEKARAVRLRDGRKLTDMELPLMGRIALKEALKKLEGTDLEKLLRRYNAI